MDTLETWQDPRGERRKIVSVEKFVKDNSWAYLTLDCGHERKANILFTYEIGGNYYCAECEATR